MSEPAGTDWVTYWDNDQSIYVSPRHREVHAQTVAADIVTHIPSPSAAILDYGCGEANYARSVAAHAGSLTLSDAAPKLRAGLAARYASDAKIKVLSPDDVAALPDASFDLIVMHSVAQYLTVELASELFALFHRLLRPGGTLIVGDIIPPQFSAASDAISLLRFAAANGFFIDAVRGLIRTLMSDYFKLRRQSGLTRYAPDAMIAKLNAAGFSTTRASKNLGHNQGRMTFAAKKR